MSCAGNIVLVLGERSERFSFSSSKRRLGGIEDEDEEQRTMNDEPARRATNTRTHSLPPSFRLLLDSGNKLIADLGPRTAD